MEVEVYSHDSHILILAGNVELHCGRFVMMAVQRNAAALHSRGLQGKNAVISNTKYVCTVQLMRKLIVTES